MDKVLHPNTKPYIQLYKRLIFFMLILTSPHNPQFKAMLQNMARKKSRQEHQVMILEGIHLLQMALNATPTCAIEQVFVLQTALEKPEVQHVLAQLPAECTVYGLTAALADKLSQLATPSELIAVAKRPQAVARPAGASAILLENIQDPGNLGTICRAAAAANVRHIYLSKECVDAYAPKVLRSAMGAHFALSIVENVDAANLVQNFEGLTLVTHLHATQTVFEANLSGAVCFVFGNEGQGVTPELAKVCQQAVIIPMPGVAESLNVAMAATVCLFEQVRQKMVL